MLKYRGPRIYFKLVALYQGEGKERDTVFRCFYMDNRMIVLWKLFPSLCFRFVSVTACAFLSYLVLNPVS